LNEKNEGEREVCAGFSRFGCQDLLETVAGEVEPEIRKKCGDRGVVLVTGPINCPSYNCAHSLARRLGRGYQILDTANGQNHDIAIDAACHCSNYKAQ